MSQSSCSRERCIEEGGHFWPDPACEGDEPQTCTHCGYNPGWVRDPNGDGSDACPRIQWHTGRTFTVPSFRYVQLQIGGLLFHFSRWHSHIMWGELPRHMVFDSDTVRDISDQ